MSAPHILELFDPSEYISAFELNGEDHHVTIARVVGGVIEGDAGRKSKKPVVTFTDWPKPMVLNKTNTKVLVKMFGTYDYTKWAGRRFTIYPTTAKFGTETVDAIRIRKTAPPPAAPKQAEKPVKTPAERAEAVIAAYRAANTIDALQTARKRSEPFLKELADAGQIELVEKINLAYDGRTTELEAPV
jgi:hypothetical protein